MLFSWLALRTAFTMAAAGQFSFNLFNTPSAGPRRQQRLVFARKHQQPLKDGCLTILRVPDQNRRGAADGTSATAWSPGKNL
jgi:hypothetical protein